MRDDDDLWMAGEATLSSRVDKAKAELDRAAKGDPDGIHDLRVAIRKVRATLSILGGTLVDPDEVDVAERDLKDLFQALGRARDDDVLIERISRLAKNQGVRGKALDRLVDAIDKERKRAKKDVQRHLRNGQGEEILDALLRDIRRAERLAPRDPNEIAPSLVRHAAGSAILSRFERVLAYELVVDANAPAPVLHRLRVAIKKLRYAVDFFEDAMVPAARRIDTLLARAQDELGELHDHTVALERIEAFRRARSTRRKGANGKIKMRKLEPLRAAEDEDAERLLAAFHRDWAAITSSWFRTAVFGAATCVRAERRPGRRQSAASRLDVRRLDRAA
jgi:CHAD domain-containing protein